MGDLITPPAVAVDYDEVAKRVWERLIPVTPVSGAFEEKFKQTIIGYEVIQVVGTVSVSAGAIVGLTFRPPADEIWDIVAGGDLSAPVEDCRASISLYDGAVESPLVEIRRDGITGGPVYYNASAWARGVVTYSMWFRMQVQNADTTSRTCRYGYSGLKFKSSSIRIAKTTSLSDSNPHNPHSSVTLPDYLKPLEKYAFIDMDGDIAIYLEKDTPLQKDEAGNVIVSLTAFCKLKSFERLFVDLIADTTKRPLMSYMRERSVAQNMGWEKYIDKWKAEGIEF